MNEQEIPIQGLINCGATGIEFIDQDFFAITRHYSKPSRKDDKLRSSMEALWNQEILRILPIEA